MPPVSVVSTPGPTTSFKGAAPPLLVALDLGTNTTLMLTARIANGIIVEQSEQARTTRLGEGVAETGSLRPEAVSRTLAAVSDFLADIPAGSPLFGVAVGTSALRDACNRDWFLDAFEARFGVRPHILSGAEEAAATFAGAASSQPGDAGVVTLDIGGGSTEIAVGTPGCCRLARSLDLGCVRFAERFRLVEAASADQVAAARQAAVDILQPACGAIGQALDPNRPVRIVASGGTAVTFAAMSLGLAAHSREGIEGYVAPTAQVVRTGEELASLSSRERTRISRVDIDRARVLPAGLLIFGEALRLLGAADCLVTCRGLRYGLLLQVRRGQIAPTWQDV